MNMKLQSRNMASKYVKLNVIYNTCMTISIAILLLQLYVIWHGIIMIVKKEFVLLSSLIGIILVLAFAFGILFHRGKKYYIYWVKNIVSAYADAYENEFIGNNN